MSKQPTMIERLTVIETLLKGAFDEGGTMPKMREEIQAIRRDFEDHKQDYQALKNKGIGAALTLSTVFAALGYVASLVWEKFTGGLS